MKRFFVLILLLLSNLINNEFLETSQKNYLYGQSSWSVTVSSDEMTGEKTATATLLSKIVPTKTMKSPYEDITATLHIQVQCNNSPEYAFIKFSSIPNITNVFLIVDVFQAIATKAKWDDTIQDVILVIRDDYALVFVQNEVVDNIAKHKTVLIQLSWHRQGKVYFRFPLSGAKGAIAKMRALCRQTN